MKTNLTYRQWMTEVEAQVVKITGLNFEEHNDWMSRDAYEDGLTVAEGISLCLEQIGFDCEMLVDEA